MRTVEKLFVSYSRWSRHGRKRRRPPLVIRLHPRYGSCLFYLQPAKKQLFKAVTYSQARYPLGGGGRGGACPGLDIRGTYDRPP